jgi:C4-dicarboxylate-specific signal transduction histidine kinase
MRSPGHESKLIQTTTPGHYRNDKTGAILNQNISELNQYMIERTRLSESSEINKKVEELTDAVSEIKEILKIMIERKNGS